jgi:hypothetical protein
MLEARYSAYSKEHFRGKKYSILTEMINGKIQQNWTTLDCNPDIFCHILEHLRFGKYPPPEKVIDVYDYASMFRLGKLME